MDKTAPIFARIPPPIWALIYVLLAAAVSALASLPPLSLLHQPAAGGTLIAIGVLVAASGATTFRRAGTQTHPAAPSNKLLVTHGPYRFTRNPMYLGITLVSAGIALMAGTLPFFIVPLVILLTNDRITIPYEEAKMERQFGEAFRSYKGKVRRWL